MSETTPESPPTEGARRLHAIVRCLLSPGIWLVLAVQMLLILSLPWKIPEEAAPGAALLALLLPVAALLGFFFLQAGAFQALTQSREILFVGEILRAGPKVFGAFVWLTVKAGLLFALVMNVLVLAIMLASGIGFEELMKRVAALFNPLTGILAFVFAYWLPYVFTQPEFRLLPSLQRSLAIGWRRLSRSGFLVIMILAPVAVAAVLPAAIAFWAHMLLNVISAMMGWIAYVYCIDVLQTPRPETAA